MQEELSQTLRIAFPFILASCHTVNDLMRSMFNLKDDYAWRKPVDNLVELAFMGGGGVNEVETGLELEVV